MQKVLGGEAGHGMLALSPDAVTRLEKLATGLAVAKDFPSHQIRETQPGYIYWINN